MRGRRAAPARATPPPSPPPLRSDAKLNAVAVKLDDIALLMKQFDLSKAVAERVLREHDGDVQRTLHALMGLPPPPSA